ncbi:hypothetical protein A3C37_02340 [Candidatus Peribacteria bacterium RIFCSPHIGHO2_02_FULL_53_20]|nr:MAG: hypothetical protein A3C37_02340 [Candidatus Peribacteria bacterium RIFCSPHIGHO2_02_FULL_53_20]OGJ70101.1 MAG: hypothetical protein A3G69_03085 [Candidatus Peribacteria bacterium RIFCSPLOWO2_12_FULL_53_10]
MSSFLQRFTGSLFFVLTGTYFLGYLLLRNSIGGAAPGWWMQIADLPLALVGILYGGASFYRTVHHGESTSWGKLIVIAIPLLVIFGALVMLNFWEILPVPQASHPS